MNAAENLKIVRTDTSLKVFFPWVPAVRFSYEFQVLIPMDFSYINPYVLLKWCFD